MTKSETAMLVTLAAFTNVVVIAYLSAPGADWFGAPKALSSKLASVVDDTTFQGRNTAEQDIAALGLPLGDVDVDPGLSLIHI